MAEYRLAKWQNIKGLGFTFYSHYPFLALFELSLVEDAALRRVVRVVRRDARDPSALEPEPAAAVSTDVRNVTRLGFAATRPRMGQAITSGQEVLDGWARHPVLGAIESSYGTRLASQLHMVQHSGCQIEWRGTGSSPTCPHRQSHWMSTEYAHSGQQQGPYASLDSPLTGGILDALDALEDLADGLDAADGLVAAQDDQRQGNGSPHARDRPLASVNDARAAQIDCRYRSLPRPEWV